MSKNILNKSQIDALNDKKWKVTPNGAYITLYSDDFTEENTWIQICQQLKVDWTTTQKIDILYFGVQINP